MTRSVFRVPSRYKNDIRYIADKIRQACGGADDEYFDIVRALEFIIPLPSYMPELELKVVDDSALGKDHARAYPDECRIEVREQVYNGAIAGIGRDRATLAHELGHLILHRDIPPFFARSFDEKEIRVCEGSEWQANVFSGQLLAPIQKLRGRTTEDIATVFGVSKPMADKQLQETTCIKEPLH